MLKFAMTLVRDIAAAIADGLDIAIDMCWPEPGPVA